jgi:hypothetical protein
MKKYTSWMQHGILTFLVAALALSFTSPALALESEASAGDEIDERLEQCFATAQDWYEIQDGNIDLAADILNQVADVVEQLKEHGFDTSEIEALLSQANGLLPDAQADHNQAASILNAHAGFEGGQVVDRQAAWDTCRSVAQALDGARRTLLEMRAIGLEIRQIVLDWRLQAGSE